MASFTAEEKEWMLNTNAQYTEMIKVVMNLATASLVLPIIFVRNFVELPAGHPASQSFHGLAYYSWITLSLSLLCGLIFYWASAKYVKVVSGGAEESFLAKLIWHKKVVRSRKWFETWRDLSAAGTVVGFLLGIAFALGFFSGLK